MVPLLEELAFNDQGAEVLALFAKQMAFENLCLQGSYSLAAAILELEPDLVLSYDFLDSLLQQIIQSADVFLLIIIKLLTA